MSFKSKKFSLYNYVAPRNEYGRFRKGDSDNLIYKRQGFYNTENSTRRVSKRVRFSNATTYGYARYNTYEDPYHWHHKKNYVTNFDKVCNFSQDKAWPNIKYNNSANNYLKRLTSKRTHTTNPKRENGFNKSAKKIFSYKTRRNSSSSEFDDASEASECSNNSVSSGYKSGEFSDEDNPLWAERNSPTSSELDDNSLDNLNSSIENFKYAQPSSKITLNQRFKMYSKNLGNISTNVHCPKFDFDNPSTYYNNLWRFKYSRMG